MAKKKTKSKKEAIETENESKEKKFTCPYCNQAFARKYDMEKHQRKHTGDKPYKCGICGKQFVQVGSLAVHMRSHTGEMPYVCDICQKGFAVKERLRLHQRTHTGKYFVLFIAIKKVRVRIITNRLEMQLNRRTVDVQYGRDINGTEYFRNNFSWF